jgi:hypothetical protein
MSRPNEALPLLDEALAPFQAWWADEAVEDILINRPGEAFVRRGAVTSRHDIPHDFVDLEAIAILAASLKRQNVGKARPLLSVRPSRRHTPAGRAAALRRGRHGGAGDPAGKTHRPDARRSRQGRHLR